MEMKVRKWTHDWKNYNFSGVTLASDDKADGMSSLSLKEVKEYLVWLACYEPAKYGRLMLSLRQTSVMA